jgi:hypothetical protein
MRRPGSCCHSLVAELGRNAKREVGDTDSQRSAIP